MAILKNFVPRHYDVSELPRWARDKVAQFPDGEIVALTGTIRLRKESLPEGTLVYLWSTTGHRITPRDL